VPVLHGHERHQQDGWDLVDTLQYIKDKFKLGATCGHAVDLVDFTRADLAVLFHELNFKTGAEIGVKEGGYSAVLCQANPGLKLFSIDPWEELDGRRGCPDHFDAEYAEKMHRAACTILNPFKNCTMIHKYSADAVRGFIDDSLDFVYIDADHELLSVIQDISLWSAKVRPGGIVSGHDYVKRVNMVHVKEAVLAYTSCYDISPWFTFGRAVSSVDKPQDRERSWMWVRA